MRARPSRSSALAFALCLFGCSAPTPIATLHQKSGTVQRDSAAQLKVWKLAEVGATFGLGDGLQTLTGSSAEVRLDDGSQLMLDESTLIRFSGTAPERHAVGFDVATGQASLHAAADELSVHTSVGLARIDPGATVVFSQADDGLHIVVEVGKAVFGASSPLPVGTPLRIQADGAVAAIAPPPPVAAPSPSPEPPAPPDESVKLAAALANVAALVRGRGASVHTANGWSPLAEGPQQLEPGTELKLARKTSVALTRGTEHAELYQNGSYVIAPRAGVLVSAARGGLSAGGTGEVAIDVPGGSIRVARDGLVNVTLGPEGAAVEVQAYDANLETRGESQQIRVGQRASIAADGQVSVQGRGLEHADVEIDAGESLVIHDPSPPTAVRFRFPGLCPDLGILELERAGKGEFAVGEGAVALAVSRGASRYTLRCASDRTKVVRRGRLTVMDDDGTRKVAARAPVTTLSADGHHYTVLYQNRLPVLTLTWPDAPAVAGLQLVHESGGKSETLRTSEPKHVFESGSLAEGRHDFYFEGGGKVSRHTRVDIQFDNAAPTATLDGPTALPAKPGQSLTVSGIALPGWAVLVAGQKPNEDAQGRFSAPVTWPSETRALAVRLSHPDRGTHVYLRRGESP